MATTLNQSLLLAIPLLPLLGALICGFAGRIIGRRLSHMAAIAGVAIACFLSLQVLFDVYQGATFNATLYEWMRIGSLRFEIGFLIDLLSATMMCVVTFVSLMVHIYTVGYMADDDGYQRFFAYISLFTFAMLMLVMSNNFLQLFFGWEAVGLVSYLLIGFWYTKPSAIFANLKAFLVNRVGDFGFILGIGLLLASTGSLNYGEIFSQQQQLAVMTLPGTSWELLTVACICLFIGAMGKSAQFPLHVWLPDSMEGPTPISALIHAATMVTAGIFMVARMSPLFEMSETVLSFMLVIGAITTFFMGLLGLVQNDIKRVIAYSTLSQLGYMTVALGASAYSVALFHLVTHAFFKALLFLAAGSVIVGMHHQQDIRQMGGLYKKMPITWITSLIGSLALIGTPLFSGFYSKESIIEAVSASHLPGAGIAYFAVVASVFVTALYSFRLFFLVFHGQPRYHNHANQHVNSHDHHQSHEPHESPWTITLPLVLLAIPSLFVGVFLANAVLSNTGELNAAVGAVFEKVLFVKHDHLAMAEIHHSFTNWFEMASHSLTTLPIWLSALGVFLSWVLYLKFPSWPAKLKRQLGFIYRILENKYYIDAFNQSVFGRGVVKFSRGLWRESDIAVIDGLVNGTSKMVSWFAMQLRRVQTGYLYHYAFAMIIGLITLLFLFVTFSQN